MAWVAAENGLAVSQQCELAGVSRSTVYAQRKPQLVCVVELLPCLDRLFGTYHCPKDKWPERYGIE